MTSSNSEKSRGSVREPVAESIRVSRTGHVATVEIDRPDKRNALSYDVLTQLHSILEGLAADSETRVAIVGSTGKVFCAGMDISGGLPETITEDAALMHRIMGRLLAIRDMPLITVARVQGPCIGGGMLLTSCCDLLVASEDASFALPMLPLGAGYIAPALSLVVGARRAKQLALEYGSSIDAATALQWGLANDVVPAAALNDVAAALAERIARAPAEALNGQKLSVNRVEDIQGFSSAMRVGIEIDAVIHFAPAIRPMQEALKSLGVRKAVDAFRAGKIEF